jgi:integrase
VRDFSQAAKWGLWKEKNPALAASVGRKRTVREKRKLSIEETQRLLAALPDDVRLICQVALFCALRISEVMGLRWKHIDLERGAARVCERFYRGDIDIVKSERANREVPLGHLVEELQLIHPGAGRDEQHVFAVQTHYRGGKVRPRPCRDDRDINQHFLRPAAKALGLYWLGFGFHAFRREAVTSLAGELGPHQAQRMAGHSKADMTLHYTLSDFEAQERAVRSFQERFRTSQNQPKKAM